MNKFIVTEYPATDETKPVLYKVYFANRSYLHKGKKLRESVDRFLDDVDRGIRGMKYPDSYSEVVKYCQQYPQVHKVMVEVVLNAEPAKLLRKETAMYKAIKNDPETLNRLDIEPYKPEWMLKEVFQKRCDPCLKTGVVSGKKIAFRFCPNCGHINLPKPSSSKTPQ